MHMRVVRFIMKCSIPTKILHWYFQIFSKCFCLCAEHIPPASSGIKAKPFRILSANRNYRSPDISLVFVKFFCYFTQLNLHTVICEQSVRAESLGTRTGCNVIGICFSARDFISVIFHNS